MKKEMKDIARSKPDYYQCWYCQYRIPYLEIKYARADYGCPRCGNSFENFTLHYKSEDKDENNNRG